MMIGCFPASRRWTPALGVERQAKGPLPRPWGLRRRGGGEGAGAGAGAGAGGLGPRPQGLRPTVRARAGALMSMPSRRRAARAGPQERGPPSTDTCPRTACARGAHARAAPHRAPDASPSGRPGRAATRGDATRTRALAARRRPRPRRARTAKRKALGRTHAVAAGAHVWRAASACRSDARCDGDVRRVRSSVDERSARSSRLQVGPRSPPLSRTGAVLATAVASRGEPLVTRLVDTTALVRHRTTGWGRAAVRRSRRDWALRRTHGLHSASVPVRALAVTAS
eukprot:scaffold870_cov393-Prasinococcus_capsulatus_cf.AAC.22